MGLSTDRKGAIAELAIAQAAIELGSTCTGRLAREDATT